MQWWAITPLVCGAAAGSASGQQLTPETLLLARIKVVMAENLARLPNYTCLQEIERSVRPAPSRRFRLIDTLRLEVALVGGRELFAWPGSGQFDDREIAEFAAPGGAIGNGAFGLHARAVFLGNGATFTHAGQQERGGRRVVRYDYRVPRMLSGYTVKVGDIKAVVGYHGSLWADATTLDLLRLEVVADDIPPVLELASAASTLEYGRVPIGDSEFLLPKSCELSMVDIRGHEHRNRTRFSGCRQYAGTSVLSFAEPPPDTAPPPVRRLDLPPGLLLDVRVDSAIDAATGAIGDPVAAVVERDARRGGRLIVPRGARLIGHVARLERRRDRTDFLVLGLEFSSLEFPGHRADFAGSLYAVGPVVWPGVKLAMAEAPETAGGWGARLLNSRPNVGVIYVRASPLRLGPGLRMTWKTIPILKPSPEEKQ